MTKQDFADLLFTGALNQLPTVRGGRKSERKAETKSEKKEEKKKKRKKCNG